MKKQKYIAVSKPLRYEESQKVLVIGQMLSLFLNHFGTRKALREIIAHLTTQLFLNHFGTRKAWSIYTGNDNSEKFLNHFGTRKAYRSLLRAEWRP